MSSRIQRLDTDTVNRIAAGEVIQRPSNALKELLENSLDAGAGSIAVVVKGGGLQLLQISDTGHGILPADFPLLCERFATSKLSVFEDLLSIRTFGFRGEALASISHVAKVTVTSMVAGAACAYKAQFSGGKMLVSEKGGEPRPCAGVKGTVIQVEELFLNVPARRAALKNTSEEYSKILEVVTRYAIHFSHRGVGFSCKKANELSPDVNISSNMSILDALGSSFGSTLKRELVRFEAEIQPVADEEGKELKSSSISSSDAMGDDVKQMKASGFVSNANYHVKRPTFIIFVNDRLVDCTQLKRAVEALYSTILPKGTHPFIYISLDLPPHTVDVNLHPTKREVGFLNQDVIVHAICRAIEAKLGNSNSSRSFLTQTLLPLASLSPAGGGTRGGGGGGGGILDGGTSASGSGDRERVSSRSESTIPILDANPLPVFSDPAPLRQDIGDISKFRHSSDSSSSNPTSNPKRLTKTTASASALAPSKTVRVDTSHGSLDAYVVPRHLTSQGLPFTQNGAAAAAAAGGGKDVIEIKEGSDIALSRENNLNIEDGGSSSSSSSSSSHRSLERLSGPLPSAMEATTLDSVRGLLRSVYDDNHEGLQLMLRRYVFVGILDRQLSLIQVGTRLLLISHAQLSRELFYQRVLQRFGRARSFTLDPPCNISDLLFIALDANNIGEKKKRKEASRDLAKQLESKGPMLEEYFSIGITRINDDDDDEVEDSINSSSILLPSSTKRIRKTTNLTGASEADKMEEEEEDGAASVSSSSHLPIYITHLPRLIDGHTPCLNYLPDFLLLLAVEVDWTSETECFQSLAQAVALFYAHMQPLNRPSSSIAPSVAGEDSDTIAAQSALHHATVAHTILPALRENFFPPRKLLRDHHVVQVAATESLYKVFERC